MTNEGNTAAFVLGLIGGILILIGGIATALMGAALTFFIGGLGAILGVWGIICGIVTIIGGIMMKKSESLHNGGILTLIFSILALITVILFSAISLASLIISVYSFISPPTICRNPAAISFSSVPPIQYNYLNPFLW